MVASKIALTQRCDSSRGLAMPRHDKDLALGYVGQDAGGLAVGVTCTRCMSDERSRPTVRWCAVAQLTQKGTPRLPLGVVGAPPAAIVRRERQSRRDALLPWSAQRQLHIGAQKPFVAP